METEQTVTAHVSKEYLPYLNDAREKQKAFLDKEVDL